MEQHAPWFVRVVGGVLTAFGLINAIGFILHPPIVVRPLETAFYLLGTVLASLGGAAAALSVRRGWPIAVAATIWGVAYGIIEFLPAQSAALGVREVADPTALTLLAIPSLAMLAALLAPRTRRWLRSSSLPQNV